VRRPDLVRGLVIAPSGLGDAGGTANMRANAEVGALMAALPPDQARAAFAASATAKRWLRWRPPTRSFDGFFSRMPQAIPPRAAGDAGRRAGRREDEVRAIKVPTL